MECVRRLRQQGSDSDRALCSRSLTSTNLAAVALNDGNRTYYKFVASDGHDTSGHIIVCALARDSMQILMQTVMQMGNAEICIMPAEQSTLA